jgi:DNA-binding LytR/AlgR family response regulator
MEQQSKTNHYNLITGFPSPSDLKGTDHQPKFQSGLRKESFLAFRDNKYVVVPTSTIAFFYIKYETTVIVCFKKHEYFVNYSLEQIQQLVSDQQFYRLNPHYLINFSVVKEVERYFARKLLVNPVISFTERLLVSKEKAKDFLAWLENR